MTLADAGLRLNPRKTEIMSSIEEPTDVSDTSGTTFTQTKEFQYLGVLFDENGNHRRSWLPDEFYNQFHERTSCLIKMYNDSEIITIDSKVDGIRTLHENIADNEGVKLAFKAYRKLEKKFGAEGRFEKMQDFTNEQMFFLGYSMVSTQFRLKKF
ncbi:hypothetical protein ANCCEY_10630 [Ancylostoma ceylanicum]|uniref:Peptidase M13 C-terminal domain-containing protein n=1 Tax=Ancylostoma ceylanicum TaxID=53326 RepID=A0A0D6LDY3_9BILA|nr:hypothetical protein ANCCEY_10630 [Ancylostoma ceylanicum]